jgi:TRAP-type C4-dicarboxylate transport system permease large subunit
LTSAFASSAGIIGAMVPMIVPIIVASGANPIAVITALVICTTVVDVAPFSSVGALVATNAPEDERDSVQHAQLKWCAAMVISSPVITGLLLVLPAF